MSEELGKKIIVLILIAIIAFKILGKIIEKIKEYSEILDNHTVLVPGIALQYEEGDFEIGTTRICKQYYLEAEYESELGVYVHRSNIGEFSKRRVSGGNVELLVNYYNPSDAILVIEEARVIKKKRLILTLIGIVLIMVLLSIIPIALIVLKRAM